MTYDGKCAGTKTNAEYEPVFSVLRASNTPQNNKGQLLRRGSALKVYKRINASTMTADESSRRGMRPDVRGQQHVCAGLHVSPPTELRLGVFPRRWTGCPPFPACRHLTRSVTAFPSSRTTKTSQRHVVMVPLVSQQVSHFQMLRACVFGGGFVYISALVFFFFFFFFSYFSILTPDVWTSAAVLPRESTSTGNKRDKNKDAFHNSRRKPPISRVRVSSQVVASNAAAPPEAVKSAKSPQVA